MSENCTISFHDDIFLVNKEKISRDLEEQWVLLAEPIQTVMRRYGVKDAYEQLKALTRGEAISKDILHQFIDKLTIPKAERERLKTLTPLK